MSRQVDIKALVSHIVRGDGGNRCRICMGDTTEGQVFLEDAVMVDGAKSLTLAELLETVTGAQVESQELPQSLCQRCVADALAAGRFRILCIESDRQWRQTTEALDQTPQLSSSIETTKSLYICMEGAHLHSTQYASSAKEALQKFKRNISQRRNYQRRMDILCMTNGTKKFNKRCVCTECGKSFVSPYYLNKHLKKSTLRSCPYCTVVLPIDKFIVHMRKSHNKLVYTCPKCYMPFENVDYLQKHIATEHVDGRPSCPTCGLSFHSVHSLQSHLPAHTLRQCPGCPLSFSNQKCYKFHRTQCRVDLPASNSTFICHDCGNTYRMKASLRIHIIQKHIHILPFQCGLCGKRTSTLSHMRRHEATHTREYTHTCLECGTQLRSKNAYDLHLRRHTGERPYKCSECDEWFISASRRKDHLLRRHRDARERRHICTVCAARFLRPHELRKHTRAVHSYSRNGAPIEGSQESTLYPYRRFKQHIKQ